MTRRTRDSTDNRTRDRITDDLTRRGVLKAASGAVVGGVGIAATTGLGAAADGNCDQGWESAPDTYPVLDIRGSDPSTSGDFPSGEDEFLAFVHGWTDEDGPSVPLENLAYTFQVALENNGYTQSTFLVRWDSDKAWDPAKTQADTAGAKLAGWLDDYMNNNSTTVKLTGHSLGSRVTFACLNELAASTDHVLDDVAVMGAAVNPDTVCDGAVYAPGIKNAAAMTNSYSSSKDTIVCNFYKLEEGTSALGCAGSACNCKGPNNCSSSSISNYDDNQVDFVENHCDYIKPNIGCVPEIVCDFEDCDGSSGGDDGSDDGGGGNGGGGRPF